MIVDILICYNGNRERIVGMKPSESSDNNNQLFVWGEAYRANYIVWFCENCSLLLVLLVFNGSSI